jgi:hypothetical protein
MMKDVILSTPGLYLYLALVGVFLLMALWPRETGPPVGDTTRTALETERGGCDAPVAARHHLDRAPFRNSAWQPQRDRRPFRDLQTTLSANYAARVERAIQTIRIGAPAGARPTDQAAG